ncbi:NADPH-dependent oxidoreductase [Actinobacteria bacterium YIM 96077]|uniref:NADPH-dependent FMN reductase n=1 Tax=Phytoactinopolyspora halophila TaxID=1981511 RepID=A0A329QJN0_9ACTN|nr:NAD(P)H-dependent oxidoreductase [Phytoactinopolyspora halophila]AYY12562.1 NADPH-dependent oxidoreductase [Actinobacteria bacterium YIM 96077]RAW12534.1 NADPH-dependent FMN reductase [Phytoactinopolyspora halophila]
MIDEPLRLTVIIGSTRVGRFGPTAAEWFAERARRRSDVDVSVVDLAECWLPDVLNHDDQPPRPVRELAPWLGDADAFVMVTPEYNHSYPAALKNAIDWYFDEWRAKPIGYVSYGGVAGGLRAVEALRLVFNELHATSVRTTVSFTNYPEVFDHDGQPIEPKRYEQAADEMIDELIWWGDALRRQRARVPYPGTQE